MKEFLMDQLQPVLLPYSIPAALITFYWLFMIIGLLDLDMLESIFGGAEGIADGAAEGAVEGTVEAAAEGSQGMVDQMGETIESVGESANMVAAAMGFLNFGKAPATVVLSLLIYCMWVLANLGHMVSPSWGASTFAAVGLFAVVFIISFAVSCVFTHFAGRPFRKLLHTYTVHGEYHLIGQICEVSSTKVSSTFGQAKMIPEGGASPVILRICCEKENMLTKGSKAVIVDYDKDKELYTVEPMF